MLQLAAGVFCFAIKHMQRHGTTRFQLGSTALMVTHHAYFSSMVQHVHAEAVHKGPDLLLPHSLPQT